MLQHDKVSGYALGIRFRPMAESDLYLYTKNLCQNFCVHKYRWRVQKYQWRI